MVLPSSYLSKPARYAEIHNRRKKQPSQKAPEVQERSSSPTQPMIELIPGDGTGNDTIDLSECDFSVRSAAGKSDFSDTDVRLTQTLRTIKDSGKLNNKERDNENNRTVIAGGSSQAAAKAVSNLNVKLKPGSFSRFQFTRQCPGKRKGLAPAFITSTPMVESHNVAKRFQTNLAMNRSLLSCGGGQRASVQKLSAIRLAMNLGKHQNEVERLISVGPLKRSVSPDLGPQPEHCVVPGSTDDMLHNNVIVHQNTKAKWKAANARAVQKSGGDGPDPSGKPDGKKRKAFNKIMLKMMSM